jgi:hypothetical protein
VQKDTTSEENFAHRWAIVWRPSSCPLMIPNHRNQDYLHIKHERARQRGTG